MSKFIKLCLVLVLLSGCFKKDEEKNEKVYNFSVQTQNGDLIQYALEEANTPEQLQKGLMNRDSIDEDGGMVFDLSSTPTGVAMWMKNTKIPLDMLFMNPQGKILWIYENAIPYSEELIVPPMPVVAVAEIQAGEVRKHKIQVGDMVTYSLFEEGETQPIPDVHYMDVSPKAEAKNDATLSGDDVVELDSGVEIEEVDPKDIPPATEPAK